MKILIIDDEKVLSGGIAKKLEQNDYQVDVIHCFEEYKKIKNPKVYRAFIIDVSLGDGNGLDIVDDLRNIHRITAPILIISGHSSSVLKVKGLDIGADDYITKPFSPDELIARIRSIMRREQSSGENSNIKTHGDISFDLQTREVYKGGKIVVFTKKEKQIVEFFLFHKNELISKQSLVDSLWSSKDSHCVTDNTINVTIYKVRKKLGEDFKLETKIGEGYILEG